MYEFIRWFAITICIICSITQDAYGSHIVTLDAEEKTTISTQFVEELGM